MTEKIKTVLLVAIGMSVLCAGTLSARQLRSNAKGFAACRGSCNATVHCSSGCICAFPLESTNGFCSSHPTGVQAPAK